MPAQANIKVLRVSARADGYRLEGLAFGTGAVDIPESILTSAQIHRLKRDPMLNCHEVTLPELLSDEEVAQLRDKARIADAFMAMVPPTFTWDKCPSEYVTLLLDHIHELELSKATAAAEAGPATKQHGRK